MRTEQEIRKRLRNLEDNMLTDGPFTEFEIIAKKAAKQALEWVLEETRVYQLTEPKVNNLERRKSVMWRGRHRCGGRGRFPKPVTLGVIPPITSFMTNPSRNLEPVFIEFAEVEAFRLVDMEGLSQEEAGQRMGISRGTIWRLVQRARRKTAQALSEGRTIYVVMSTPNRSAQTNNEMK